MRKIEESSGISAIRKVAEAFAEGMTRLLFDEPGEDLVENCTTEIQEKLDDLYEDQAAAEDSDGTQT